MPFVDLKQEQALGRGLEGLDEEEFQSSTKIGISRKRSYLIAVAIMANMEKQGRTLAVVTRPYAYEHDVLSDGRIEIPEGFVTDFASIPSAFRFIFSPFGRHAPAAVIHDYLYAVGQQKSRKYADFIFKEAMRESGVSTWRRTVMYLMVRLFGGRGYGLHEDWTFFDHEFGVPIEPPENPPEIGWLTWKDYKAKQKAA